MPSTNFNNLINKDISYAFGKKRIEVFIVASTLIHFCVLFMAVLFIFSSQPIEDLLNKTLSNKEDAIWIKIDFSPPEEKDEPIPEKYSALSSRNRRNRMKAKPKKGDKQANPTPTKVTAKIKGQAGDKAALRPIEAEGLEEETPGPKGDSLAGADIPIPLDTRRFEYISYFSEIKERIERSWKYPDEAFKNGENGNTTVQLHINRDGTLAKVSIYLSSGVRILDEEAIRAVVDASPFNPIPKEIEADQLNIVATFGYHLGFVTE